MLVKKYSFMNNNIEDLWKVRFYQKKRTLALQSPCGQSWLGLLYWLIVHLLDVSLQSTQVKRILHWRATIEMVSWSIHMRFCFRHILVRQIKWFYFMGNSIYQKDSCCFRVPIGYNRRSHIPEQQQQYPVLNSMLII